MLCHPKHFMRIYQGTLLSSRLKYMNKAITLQMYETYNWQHAGATQAICTVCVEGRRVGSGELLCALRVAGENEFGCFNPDPQTAKFNSPSNFPAIQYKFTASCIAICNPYCK